MAIETRPPPRQPLVMAPLLRQAIQLLQLSPLELQEMGRNERLGNPLLDAAVPQTVATTLETTPPMPVQPAAAGIASASSG